MYNFLTFFTDPVKIIEEGQYNLNNLKEISVTDSFMGLDRATRNCQESEKYEDCKTWLHVDSLRKECGCLPLALRLSEKVKAHTNIVNQNCISYVSFSPSRIICAQQEKK